MGRGRVCIWKGGVYVHEEREGVQMEGRVCKWKGGVCVHGERAASTY